MFKFSCRVRFPNEPFFLRTVWETVPTIDWISSDNNF